MRKIFTATFLLASPGIHAQSFIISPDDTLEVTANFNQLGVHDIYQENNTFDTIQLLWNPVLVDLPSGWDYSMCDLGHCYIGIPGGTMDPLPSAQSAFLGLNINPMSISGIGTVRVYVYDQAYPSQGDTLTWIVRTADFAGISENTESEFLIFPNPASQFVNIQVENAREKNFTVELSDITGKVLSSINSNQSLITFPIEGYSPGMYLIRITNENNIQLNKSLIIR